MQGIYNQYPVTGMKKYAIYTRVVLLPIVNRDVMGLN